MRIQKSVLGTSALTPALSPRRGRSQGGYTLYIVAFLIFVLLGWVVYYIATLYAHPFPVRDPEQHTANTNEVWRSTTTARYLNIFGGDAMSAAGFRVEYGFDTGLGPWVDLQHLFQDYVELDAWGFDETDYGLIAVINGEVYRFDPAGVTLLDDGLALKGLVIERSTNLVDWSAVFTNSTVEQNSVKAWTDATPAGAAYYRTRLVEADQ